MAKILILFAICLLATAIHSKSTPKNDEYMKVPIGLKLGVATSAHQIEGAWNVSDKGINIWDWFAHQNPSPIKDGKNGDIACDSYNRYKEDIALLKDLGVDFYRLSLSWSRILPTGFANKVSKDGIQYYKNLLDDLNALGIEPLVTIYHWDHPLALEELGGWTNELMTTWFTDYARVVFRELGDRIKTFATINEPLVVCNEGYGDGVKAPGKKTPRLGSYLCMHNILKAHAKTYHIYNEEFRSIQRGKIGIVIPCLYPYPKNSEDQISADKRYDFECGWTAHPIYSAQGDYPETMKRQIAENSKLEGYPRSRLPEFTQEEIEYIRGSADYFGLNHYTSVLTETAPKTDTTLWYRDSGVITTYNESWPHTASTWLRVVPQGFGDLLRKIKTIYNNPPVYVLENGLTNRGIQTYDHQRVGYLHDYIKELLLAVNRDGCNVKGYTVWSLIDNYEWEQGYTEKFGLVSVDFENPNRPRTPKLSYEWYQTLIRTRELPEVITNFTRNADEKLVLFV